MTSKLKVMAAIYVMAAILGNVAFLILFTEMTPEQQQNALLPFLTLWLMLCMAAMLIARIANAEERHAAEERTEIDRMRIKEIEYLLEDY